MDIKRSSPVASAGRPGGQPVRTSMTANKRGLPKVWLAVIGGVVALGLLAALAYSVFGIGSPVDRSKYQAVFLDNGQVYFGKLHGWGGSQPVLTEVYYFQSSTSASANSADAEDAAPNSQTLVKLGEEIHKPSDKLILNPDAVLFVENIEDDGQVMNAIKQDQSDDN